MLIRKSNNVNSSRQCKKAIRFADAKCKTELEGYIEYINEAQTKKIGKLEEERKALLEQIDILKTSSNEQIAALNKEIAACQYESNYLFERIKSLYAEKAALGVFKGREKKNLQEKIDLAEADLNAIKVKESVKASELKANIATIKVNTQKSISSLQSKVDNIDTELTKAR